MTEVNIKVWTASKNSPAGVQVSETSAVLVGNKYNFVAAHENGVAISGNSIAFNTTSENIRKGGLFVEMNDFVKMVPTTIVTPMPEQIPYPPFGMVSGIIKDLPFFIAMVAAVSIAGSQG